MNISGFVTLKIQGNDLDFDYICKNINLQPINMIKKEERNNKCSSFIQDDDRWTYEVEFDGDQSINDVLVSFIATINVYRPYLIEIKNKYSVSLWCDIYSDYAQFGFNLNAETINKIAELGVGIEIQLYSHGEVID